MSTTKKVPIVAIVGRANVGKSSLFNAIIGRREAIVADEPGTTRDSITAKATIFVDRKALEAAGESFSHLDGAQEEVEQHTESYTTYDEGAAQTSPPRSAKNTSQVSGSARKQGGMVQKDFWLVDTAGMKDANDDFELTIQEQIIEAASAADIIMVTVEADVPINEEDRRVAKLALKSKKPVLLIVNKLDKNRRVALEDYMRLGIKPIFGTSVTQRVGIDDLLEHVASLIPRASIKEDDGRMHIALLGRPNVGKSALFNTLAKKQQAIVADRAGTTRDVNRAIVRYKQQEMMIMDTAGIRKNGKIQRGVEHFSVLRSLSAIEQADICFLLMDANELNVQLDQKIAGMIKDAGRGLVLVVSKWDSIDKDAYTRDMLAPQIAQNFEFVPWAPLIFTSAVSGQNVAKLFDLVLEIMERRSVKYKTTELNQWLRHTINKHPPAGLKNRMPKLNYMVHEQDNPIPSFKVFGAHTKFLHWSYKRYMEREFRANWNLEGSPLKFWFIEKH